jgi:hypothetical protein
VLKSIIKHLEVYAYICIVRSIFFAHAVADVDDVDDHVRGALSPETEISFQN